MTPWLLLLIPLYALADRFAGGGWPKLDARLPGRGVAWAAALCGAVGWLLAGPPAALLALVWFIYRTPGWRVFGGSATPDLGSVWGTFLRHLIAAPFALVVAYWFHLPLVTVGFLFTAYAVSATGLAVIYAYQIADLIAWGRGESGQNARIELARGALYGLAVAVALA